MRIFLLLLIIFSFSVLLGCSRIIEDERLEARDKYLISKTKGLETMVKLYHLEFLEYPTILDASQDPKSIKIYYGSKDWQELEEKFKLTPSLKDVKVELTERILNENPIEYFSNGSSYVFNVNLNENKKYNYLGDDYQCKVNKEGLCVLTISSQ